MVEPVWRHLWTDGSDLPNIMQELFLVIFKQNILYHIRHTSSLSHTISFPVPGMMPQTSRWRADKTGSDGKLVVKLPWGMTRNTYLIILLFSPTKFWFPCFSQNPLVLSGSSLYMLVRAFRRESIIISVYIPQCCECALKGICICPYALIGLFLKTCLLSVCAKCRVTEYLSVYLFLCKHTPSFTRVTRFSFVLHFLPRFYSG